MNYFLTETQNGRVKLEVGVINYRPDQADVVFNDRDNQIKFIFGLHLLKRRLSWANTQQFGRKQNKTENRLRSPHWPIMFYKR